MPSPNTPALLAENLIFQSMVAQALLAAAVDVQNEAAIASPTAGHKVYNKRQAYALKITQNKEFEAYRAAPYIARLKPDMAVSDEVRFDFFTNTNPSGSNLVFCKVADNNTSTAGANDTNQIFNILAGVSAIDLI